MLFHQMETKRPANPQKPASRTRCSLKLRRTQCAAHQNRDKTERARNRTTHSLEARGIKKRYLRKLSSQIFSRCAQPADGKNLKKPATRRNQRSKQASAKLSYLSTRCQARMGLGGREKQSEPKRWTFHAGDH